MVLINIYTHVTLQCENGHSTNIHTYTFTHVHTSLVVGAQNHPRYWHMQRWYCLNLRYWHAQRWDCLNLIHWHIQRLGSLNLRYCTRWECPNLSMCTLQQPKSMQFIHTHIHTYTLQRVFLSSWLSLSTAMLQPRQHQRVYAAVVQSIPARSRHDALCQLPCWLRVSTRQGRRRIFY
jgi:hypothetical protein